MATACTYYRRPKLRIPQLNDFTVRYEEREVQLSHLTGLDFFVSYWSEGLVGHTFLSFIFDMPHP